MNSDRVKKHTLDSDEEDNVGDDHESNKLDEEEIEGDYESRTRQVEGQRITAFNMKEEMEEGHFDRDGHFIWKNEKEIRDNWLDNIDWQKISKGKNKYNLDEDKANDDGDESSSSSDEEETNKRKNFNELNTYKEIITYMKPKETINRTLKRLGGNLGKMSSVERLKRKKEGTLPSNVDVTNMTELVNNILTYMGNMNVYQETYEEIERKLTKLPNNSKPKMDLDMYSDDFDMKEKEKLQQDSGDTATTSDPSTSSSKSTELLWEFKWKPNEDIQGPFNTAQMLKWSQENYFKSGVLVRKCGESTNFYSSSRIDFELYE